MIVRILLKPVLTPCYDSVMHFKTRVCVTYSQYQEAVPVQKVRNMRLFTRVCQGCITSDKSLVAFYLR
jgi:hypothetical protein